MLCPTEKKEEFKDFSRHLSDFPVLFKAYLIFNYFSRKPSKLKYFSSLCEPCFNCPASPYLGPNITDGNTKLCCQGFVLALLQSTTANKIDSEHTRDYTKYSRYSKLKYNKLQQIKLKPYHLFRLISDDFRPKVPKIAKKGTLVSC